MKKYTIIGLLCFTALVGLFTISKSTAQGNPSVKHTEYIYLFSTTLWGHDNKFGAFVLVSNGSSGAPQIPYLSSLPQVLADLDEKGYQIVQLSSVANDGMVLLRKP